MIVKRLTQALNAGTHGSCCFLVSLPYKQVSYFIIYFRIIQETRKRFFTVVITGAQHSKISKEVKRIKAAEHGVSSTHR